MTAIWQREGDDWTRLAPVGFPDEAALHKLVEEAPQLLPLSGAPDVVVVGSEVLLGSGYADLVAIEPGGRLVVIEVKLAGNSEARRAVVAQILAYAAVLRGMSAETLESQTLSKHLQRRGCSSLLDAVEASDQAGAVDADAFGDGLESSLATGAFRLVLVLDAAPAELVRLVGYLESMTQGLVIDLITVSAYRVGERTVMVPQRVDPGRDETAPVGPGQGGGKKPASYYEPDGGADFIKTLEAQSDEIRAFLAPVIEWARALERDGLAQLYSFHSATNATLLPRLPGQDVGPFTVWGAGRVTAFESVLEANSPMTLEKLNARLEKPVSRGTLVTPLDEGMFALMRAAYEEAASRD